MRTFIFGIVFVATLLAQRSVKTVTAYTQKFPVYGRLETTLDVDWVAGMTAEPVSPCTDAEALRGLEGKVKLILRGPENKLVNCSAKMVYTVVEP
jgi:hypothetical protein